MYKINHFPPTSQATKKKNSIFQLNKPILIFLFLFFNCIMEDITQFTKRPGVGQEGRPIKIRANFFEITKLPEMDIIHYDASIDPTVPRRLNRKIFNQFVERYRETALGGARPVFDGMYSIKKNIFHTKTKRNIISFIFELSMLCNV